MDSKYVTKRKRIALIMLLIGIVMIATGIIIRQVDRDSVCSVLLLLLGAGGFSIGLYDYSEMNCRYNQVLLMLKKMPTDQATIRQVIFLLEEAEILSLKDVYISIDHKNNKQKHKLVIPVSQEWAELILTWKSKTSDMRAGRIDKEELKRWKESGI